MLSMEIRVKISIQSNRRSFVAHVASPSTVMMMMSHIMSRIEY